MKQSKTFKEPRRRFATYVLVLLMLSAIVIAAFSCGPAEETPGTAERVTSPPATNQNGGTGAGNENGNGENGVRTFQFPSGADFEGQPIRIITHDNSAWAWSEITTEELTGEPINDAIYHRNARVEAGLNVEIVEFHGGDAAGRARRAIQAGSDEFDVVFTNSADAGPLAVQGMYLDLNDILELELDAPWWNQNAHESAELLGRLFFTTSDGNLVTNDAIWVLYFNTQILQDLQLDCPYTMVREGRWTMENYYAMLRASAIDRTGSGIWTVEDQWGISTHHIAFMAFFIGQGQMLTGLDNHGEPYLIVPDDRFVSAFYNAHRVMDQASGLFLNAQGGYPGRTEALGHATRTFMANMSLFAGETLSHARVFREMTADFGLLPHPKYDEHQENHYTFMIDTVPAFGIPVTVREPYRIGLFMNAFTAISAEILMPAYYEASLHGRFTRDEDSIEMLDIIRERRVFDRSVIYNWANYYVNFFTHGVTNPNPVTLHERFERMMENQIQRTLDQFLMLD